MYPSSFAHATSPESLRSGFTRPVRPSLDAALVAHGIATCVDASILTEACADAFRKRADFHRFEASIRTSLVCALVCEIAGDSLARIAEVEPATLRMQLEACLRVCATAGAACDRHADDDVWCRVCVDACIACEGACRELLRRLPPAC